MRINSTTQNRIVHNAKVDHDEVLRAAAELVAAKIGISLDDVGVTWRAHHSTRDTSHGIYTDVSVEIIDDHTAKPAAA